MTEWLTAAQWGALALLWLVIVANLLSVRHAAKRARELHQRWEELLREKEQLPLDVKDWRITRVLPPCEEDQVALAVVYGDGSPIISDPNGDREKPLWVDVRRN